MNQNQGHRHADQTSTTPKQTSTIQKQLMRKDLYTIQQKPSQRSNIEVDTTKLKETSPYQINQNTKPSPSKLSIESSNSGKKNKKHELNKKQAYMKKQKDVLTSSAFALPKGLPNIGNNCFLNSVIQLLFSATKFKNLMIQKYKNAKNTKYQHFSGALLGSIFYQLQNQGHFEQSLKESLEKFLVCLEKLNLSYIKYSQEDAFETLNNLLCNLEDYTEQEIIQIKQLFEIQTKIECSCLANPIITASFYVNSSPQICQKCRQHFTTTTIKFPRYMIIHRYNHPLKRFYRQGQQYELKCNIRYLGNGQSGHYNAQVYNSNQKYLINDNYVSHVFQQYPKEICPIFCVIPLNCCSYMPCQQCYFPIFCCCFNIRLLNNGCDANVHFSLTERIIPTGSSIYPNQDDQCWFNCVYGGSFYNLASNICPIDHHKNEVIQNIQWCCLNCCRFGIPNYNAYIQ